MNTTSTPSPFARLRANVVECLRMIGVPGDIAPEGITVRVAGRDLDIPFFQPQLADIEQVVYDTLRDAGTPLLQKEIVARTRMGRRYVQDATSAMRKRGVILHHPTLGFYLPGTVVAG